MDSEQKGNGVRIALMVFSCLFFVFLIVMGIVLPTAHKDSAIGTKNLEAALWISVVFFIFTLLCFLLYRYKIGRPSTFLLFVVFLVGTAVATGFVVYCSKLQDTSDGNTNLIAGKYIGMTCVPAAFILMLGLLIAYIVQRWDGFRSANNNDTVRNNKSARRPMSVEERSQLLNTFSAVSSLAAQ